MYLTALLGVLLSVGSRDVSQNISYITGVLSSIVKFICDNICIYVYTFYPYFFFFLFVCVFLIRGDILFILGVDWPIAPIIIFTNGRLVQMAQVHCYSCCAILQKGEAPPPHWFAPGNKLHPGLPFGY